MVYLDKMIMHCPIAESEALTTVYEIENHIEKGLPGLEAVYPTSRPVKMCDNMHVAMWMIEVRQGRLRGLSAPKVKFLKLMPRSDGTKVRRAQKGQFPQGLVAV